MIRERSSVSRYTYIAPPVYNCKLSHRVRITALVSILGQITPLKNRINLIDLARTAQ